MFFTNHDCKTPIRQNVDVLWPDIDQYIAMQNEEKATNYFGASKAMHAALVAAKLRVPDWFDGRANGEENF
ncbi:hypothetical protein X753_24075 [Mesorhizobium sp. LNJC399B00]|nr:hypothetical protein X753_24075 [Mesorhizobium sp. LNJC399B00]